MSAISPAQTVQPILLRNLLNNNGQLQASTACDPRSIFGWKWFFFILEVYILSPLLDSCLRIFSSSYKLAFMTVKKTDSGPSATLAQPLETPSFHFFIHFLQLLLTISIHNLGAKFKTDEDRS
jgi:hypothetical protein